jgi:uncharacterized hydrophobic protein (TIGR00271 family)
MLHLRLVTSPELADRALELLESLDYVINITRLPGAGLKPKGDMLSCDVAREECSALLEALREMGCDTLGTIAVEQIHVSLSKAAERAEQAAAGSPADAVIWEEVTARTSESAELSPGFLLFMVLATAIAAVGILTDSVVLIIGAMVVGPEFGPIAGVCVALVQQRMRLAARSLLALSVGFPLGIAVAYVGTLTLIRFGVAPAEFTSAHPQTMFISRPDVYSAIIAALAGIAGMLSLTTAKSGALIGVLISVTTIPAAANIAVAAAYENVAELDGASRQLGINLLVMLAAGAGTLSAQRIAYMRRLKDGNHARRPS